MTHIQELRGKSRDELKEQALTLRKELFNLRFQVASGEQQNTSRFRAVRRDIARIQTMLNDPQQANVNAKPVKEKKAAKKSDSAAPKETKAKKPAKKKASEE